MPFLSTFGAASARSRGLRSGLTGPGQIAFTTAGTYTWIAPAGITSVCVVCVGGGSRAGGGGALAYGNGIAVTPGQSYTVVVGATNVNPGGQSYFGSAALLYANGGSGDTGGSGGGTARTGGGSGGNAGIDRTASGGGGGAGGYSGNGGNGGNGTDPPASDWNWGGPSSGGSGGGGGGGAGGSSAGGGLESAFAGGAGGGVGILGQGASGAGIPDSYYQGNGNPGSGGVGAAYGGGAGQDSPGYGMFSGSYNPGGSGAVRIIWGPGRSFPSTNTGNV